MDKVVESWDITQLRNTYNQIDFPEYQREPNLWTLLEKQRLIDSIVRRFDIASLYFYRHENGSLDCVDGRQRIGAIMSFLGDNTDDTDANFHYRHHNEILEEAPLYPSLADKSYSNICSLSVGDNDAAAESFMDRFLTYPLTIVMLSDSSRAEEFNLQFTRLNLGTVINSGEKLHAMVGDMREECFKGLGTHPFLTATRIPTRRYAREQVAAQILAHVFTFIETGKYARTRHFDLQRLFKRLSVFDTEQLGIVERLNALFDLLAPAFQNSRSLRNRAITVSTVLLAWNVGVETEEQTSELAEFMEAFVDRLTWQIKKGVLVDHEYLYLVDFQRNSNQASAEGYSVEARAQVLAEEFARWKESKELKGDREWKASHPSLDLSVESQQPI